MNKNNNYSVQKILAKTLKQMVYIAIDAHQNQYIIKKISLTQNNEMEFWEQIQDKSHFVQLLTQFTNEHEKSISFVFEYIPYSLKTKPTISNFEFKSYIKQLLLGIESMHDQDFIHCNLCAENCLISNNLYLTDFSYSQKLGINGIFDNITNSTAPEILLGCCKVTQAIDIWSIGCVISEVLLGKFLFEGKTGVEIFISIIKILGTPSLDEFNSISPNQVNNVNLIKVPKKPLIEIFQYKVDYYVIDLISKMLQYKPEKRISIKNALDHPYFIEQQFHTFK